MIVAAHLTSAMDCDLYLNISEHKELKAFGLKQSFPLSLLVLKCFQYVSDKIKKGSTDSETPGIHKCPPTHTHEKEMVGAQKGGAERREINQK